MAESPPDFDQLAGEIVDLAHNAPLIAAALRCLWNARGAADLATIEAALAVHPPSVLDQIRALDR